VRVKETTKRAKRKWRVGDLLADERCSPAVSGFLRGTYVGRAAPPVEETWESEDEGDGAVGRVRRRRGEGACGMTRGPGFLCYFSFYV